MPLLQKDDIIVDGGNSKWRDDEPHAARCAEFGVKFMDCGTSGGVWGLQNGYALMVGGDKATYDYMKSIWTTLAPRRASMRLRLVKFKYCCSLRVK